MINRYVIAAAIATFLAWTSYTLQFYISLGYGISEDPAVWGQLGDYLGGILNPVLSFISVVLLIKSLTLQNEANQSLTRDLINSEKTEKIRAFEALFFNMIDAQKDLFKNFAIDILENDNTVSKHSTDAVIAIENELENLKDGLHNEAEIRGFLEEIDSRDQIFGVVRVFYIIVKIISERLGESQGFHQEERKSHLHALVNFTDFAQLRLILIAMRFMDFESVKYLKSNDELIDVMTEVGLDYSLY